MKNRLIELIRQAEHKCSAMANCKRCEQYGLGGDCQRTKIADHLLAEGVIVTPCKVGDTVYVVSQGAGFSVVWNVYKATAKAIHIDQWGKLFVRVETDKTNVGGYVEIERLFLTREEAEKALAERSNP